MKPFKRDSINIQCMEQLIMGNLRRVEVNLDEAIYLFNQMQIAINRVNLPELTHQIKQYEVDNRGEELCESSTFYQWATELEWDTHCLTHSSSPECKIESSLSRALTIVREWKWRMKECFNGGPDEQ